MGNTGITVSMVQGYASTCLINEQLALEEGGSTAGYGSKVRVQLCNLLQVCDAG